MTKEKKIKTKKSKKLTPEERNKKSVQQKMALETAWNDPIHENTIHRIIIGDSRKMSKISDNSVHHIVTSPPYFNAKEYSQWDSLDSYLNDLELTFKECFRVLVPNRKFCLNISDLPEKGPSGVRWIALGPEALKRAQKVGFELVDRIIWFKTPIKGFQYGSLPFPPSPLICDSMEYVYVLRKPGKPNYSHLSKKQKEASRLLREEYMEYTKQIWSIRRVRLKDNVDGHIAPFPDELPHRTIKLYSYVGETVLDPFGGSGTTSKAAIINKRNSILYEINKDYLKYIKTKLDYNQEKLTKKVKIVIENE